MEREKVAKNLEECIEHIRFNEFEKIPFWGNCQMAMTDALALLKEQEAQLVLNIGEQISCKSGSCPKCGKMLNTTCNKRYCGDCGQAVKWE